MSKTTLGTLTIARNSLALIAFLGFAYSTVLWTQEFNTLPQTANSLTGNVYPRNIHGKIVYQTRYEYRKLETVDIGSRLVFVAGVLVMLIQKKRVEKQKSVLVE